MYYTKTLQNQFFGDEYIMQATNNMLLPIGRFELCLNGKPLCFTPEHVKDFGFYLENGKRRDPDEMYNIWLPISKFKKGDVITAKIIGAPMWLDAGDERMLNMIGQKDGVTYGLGAVDLYDYEPEGLIPFYTCFTNNGFEITFKGNPAEYTYLSPDYRILFQITWVTGTGDDEYNTIWYCTSG